MRNIAVFALLVIIFFGARPIEAQENPYGLSLGYQCGFLYGQAEEIVYPPASAYSGTELYSQLLWNMKPVFYNGLQLDFARINPLEKWSFFASLALKYGIPGKSGTMEDRDWLSIENNALTHFSSHDNITKELFMADATAGIALPLKSLFLLKVYVDFSYMHFHFSGMDGYGIYARGNPANSGKYHPIDDNPDLVDFNGKKVTNYTQKWMIIAFGFSFYYYANKYFSAGVSFQISPLIACNGLDEHFYYSSFQSDVQFNDTLRGGLLLEPGIALSFSPISWLTIALECSWRHISKTKGASYNRAYGSTYYIQQGTAGAGLSIINTGLRLKVRL